MTCLTPTPIPPALHLSPNSDPHPQTHPPMRPPPQTTVPLTHSPAYLPGLQLLHQKWGQGQAEVREWRAHGNGSGDNQSNLRPLPPPPSSDQTEAEAEAGSAVSACMPGNSGRAGDWEKPQGQILRGEPGWGCGTFQHCFSNDSTHTHRTTKHKA